MLIVLSQVSLQLVHILRFQKYLNMASITETKFPTKGFSLSIDITVCIIVRNAVNIISLTSKIVLPMFFLKVNSKMSDNILTHNSTYRDTKVDLKIRLLELYLFVSSRENLS